MLKKKEIRKIVELAVKASVKDSKIITTEVARMIKVFKKLSPAEAIMALTEYKKSLDQIQKKHTLLVESGVEISGPEMKQIEKSLTPTFHILSSTFQLNPSLLGGLRITIGDVVLDDSIKNRIMEVKEVIAN